MGEGADPPEPESAFVGDEHGKDVASEEKPEEFTITFEDITVHVPEIKGFMSCCSSKDNPFKNYGAEYFGMSVEERAAFYTLDRVSGLVKSGEVRVLADGFDSKGNECVCFSAALLYKIELHVFVFATSLLSPARINITHVDLPRHRQVRIWQIHAPSCPVQPPQQVRRPLWHSRSQWYSSRQVQSILAPYVFLRLCR